MSESGPMSRSGKASGSAFTIIELAVAIAVIAVMVAIILPALSASRRSAAVAATLSNLKQHASTLMEYVGGTGNGKLPWPGPARPDGFLVDDPTTQYFDFCSSWSKAFIRDGVYSSSADPSLQSPFKDIPGDYFLSCSVFALPEYWNTYSRTGASQLLAVSLAATTFPSQKAGIVDVAAIWPSKPFKLPSNRNFIAAYLDGSAAAGPRPTGKVVATGDGMFAGAIHTLDQNNGMHTWDGVRGRDR